VASIREAIEGCGGMLQYDTQGQPTAIDLAVERGSTNQAAYEAAVSCPSLKSLRVRAAVLSADDFSKIATLTSLEELMLEDAAITDGVLKQIADALPELQRFRLRNAPQITDRGIADLATSSRLTHLTLIDLLITGQAVESIAEMPSLVSLDLRMCSKIECVGLAALMEAPRLKELKLGGSGIDDTTMNIAVRLPHLESLTVDDASLGAEGLATLAQNRKTADRIRILTVARCSALSDDALKPLAAFSNLERLTLRDVPITGSFLESLPSPHRLELLSLNQTFLSDEAFDAIAACRYLKRLEVAESPLSAEALERIATLSSLEYLNLSDCGLDDELLEPIAALKNLNTLILEGNPDVTRPR